MSVLVNAEHDNASIRGATLNTVTAARGRAAGGGHGVVAGPNPPPPVPPGRPGAAVDGHVLGPGHNAGAAAAAAAQIAGVAKVMHADAPGLAHGLAENMAAQVLALQGGG